MDELRIVVESALSKGEGVLFHCKAGVHRGPLLGGIFLGLDDQAPFEEALRRIGDRRAISPHEVRRRREGDALFDWAKGQVNRGLIPLDRPAQPTWLTSARSNSIWHLVSSDLDNGPFCKWRQSANKAFFKGETIKASATEALVYDRRFILPRLLHCISRFRAGREPQRLTGSVNRLMAQPTGCDSRASS